MVHIWEDLHQLFPSEPLPLRMLMRAFRKREEEEEGLIRLHQLVPSFVENAAQVRLRQLGYIELRAYRELDAMMAVALPRFPANRAIRLKYIEALAAQGRLAEAAQQAQRIGRRAELAPAALALIERVESAPLAPGASGARERADALVRIVESFRSRRPRPVAGGGTGPFLFFTGQLGAGGAERQMTRLAILLQRAWDRDGGRVGVQRLLAPPAVCVRHASPASGADFFLPGLVEAGVDTTILAACEDGGEAHLGAVSPELLSLFRALPEDVKRDTRKLTPLLRSRGHDAVYLWQDGAVMSGALAALLAGVPRIVTSFRGLPPNIRTERMRAEMPGFFRALIRVPGVRYTANSDANARAYEEWLDLPRGSVDVVYNAVPMPDAAGDAADSAAWEDIRAASPDCTRTVLGIFRFDQNKRPDLWIESAAALLQSAPQTRFVILGAGTEFDRCRRLRDALGLQNRLFLPGQTRNVGFFLARSDVLLHLARWEGLPNAVIEAQLCGVPVLATSAGGTGEIVHDGETGLLLPDVPDPDPQGVAAALGAMLSQPLRLQEFSQAARWLTPRRFDPDPVLERTLDLFAGDACAPDPAQGARPSDAGASCGGP